MLTQGKSGLSVEELSHKLQLDYSGKGNQIVTSVSSLGSATTSDLCFLESDKYLTRLRDSFCGAVIVPHLFNESIGCAAVLYAENPHLAFVEAIHLLKPELVSDAVQETSIHPSAQLDRSTVIGQGVSIGANCTLGAEVIIGDGVHISAGCVLESGVIIGADSRLMPNVTLCHDVKIGKQVILHSGVVIGADGFGLLNDEGHWVKVPQLGSVRIGNRVEIGANTTVDRGTLDDTIIENGVKLDNLIQIAHNVRIGENTAIAACVGIAGSTIIGKNCRIFGAVGITGHLTIADNVTITAMSLVPKSIKQSGTYSSGTPLMDNYSWHRNNVRYKSLDKLARSVSRLEKSSPSDEY